MYPVLGINKKVPEQGQEDAMRHFRSLFSLVMVFFVTMLIVGGFLFSPFAYSQELKKHVIGTTPQEYGALIQRWTPCNVLVIPVIPVGITIGLVVDCNEQKDDGVLVGMDIRVSSSGMPLLLYEISDNGWVLVWQNGMMFPSEPEEPDSGETE